MPDILLRCSLCQKSFLGGGILQKCAQGGEYAKHTSERENMSNILPGGSLCRNYFQGGRICQNSFLGGTLCLTFCKREIMPTKLYGGDYAMI